MSRPDIIKSKYTEGVYFVKDQEWRVGTRYVLSHLLGSGSFSSVCCALDQLTGQKVALKRIPDILSSPELARRVLREICILRRLRHPFVITLLDAFLTPSSTGSCKLVNGELQSSSLDCYLAMELGEDGDLFHLKGQISREEVRILVWQLLHALKHLHALDVWHRDVKSSNVMLMRGEGHRLVKLADFGSSRSATQGGYHFAEQGAPEPRFGGSRMPLSKLVIQMYQCLSIESRLKILRQEQRAAFQRGDVAGLSSAMEVDSNLQNNSIQPEDLLVQLGHNEKKGEGIGFSSPLTRVVATPCYRAPEVVLSRGGYTSAVDMWSVGCILGELLQRVPRIGSAATPNLMVAPLFAIHAGILKTPALGERWSDNNGPGDLTTRTELLALFDVIGTPSWADAEDVASFAWRKYLQKLPGRAPSLYRRFQFAGEVAVHLMSRLLAFDPAARCTAEEALQHEFFAGLESMKDVEADIDVWAGPLAGAVDNVTLSDPSTDQQPVLKGLKSQVDAAEDYQAAKKLKMDSLDTPTKMEIEGAMKEASSAEPEPYNRERYIRALLTDPDAAHALAMLESEMIEGDDSNAQIQHLTMLLQAECKAQEQDGVKRYKNAAMGNRRKPWPSPHHSPQHSNKGLEGFQVDDSQTVDQSTVGFGRLNNVADTWNAKLDIAEHLKPGRHGEWTLRDDQRASPTHVWGVSTTVPGTEHLDPKVQEVIRSQQLR